MFWFGSGPDMKEADFPSAAYEIGDLVMINMTMAVQDALWKHENPGTGFRAKPSAMQKLIQKQFPDCL